MSLYDVIDEISQRSTQQTELGDTRVYGVMLGVVVKNYDKASPGRVCVNIPARDDKTNELKWVRQAFPSFGTGWGCYFLPEVGDQVLLAFEGGDIEKPYIIGCVPKDDNRVVSAAADAQNQYKRIVTRHGSTIAFEDSAQGGGKNDKITVETAGGQHTFLMDNENGVIRISDKEKKNMVEMKTAEGTMTVKTAAKLTVEVGDSIKVILNGESGTVKIEAQNVQIKASEQIKAGTDGMMKLEASQISAEASSVLKAGSGGMVQISGNPIKIG